MGKPLPSDELKAACKPGDRSLHPIIPRVEALEFENFKLRRIASELAAVRDAVLNDASFLPGYDDWIMGEKSEDKYDEYATEMFKAWDNLSPEARKFQRPHEVEI